MAISVQGARAAVDGIAVDFGGTKICVARLIDGLVVDHRRLATDSQAHADQQINTVAGAIASLDPRPDERIVVGASGRIDQEGRWYAINENTLSGIDGIPLRQRLTERFQRPVMVVNDAIAGAAGEAHAGAGQGCRRFAYITVSTGVGGCCMLDSEPLMSPDGLAGNIGFMTCRAGAELCGSGRYGTLESIASGTAIARASERIGHTGLTAKEVSHYCRDGAPWAVMLIRQSAAAIAEVGANLAVVAGISRLILGGSVGLAEGYCELVSAAMQEEPELFRLDVVPAQLGQNSVLIGALAFGLAHRNPGRSGKFSLQPNE